MNKKILNGRTLTVSIAADNGRAPEFIRKRVYNSETGLCFECGDHGHLSYECPKNQLGPRARPQPKKPRRGFGGFRDREDDDDDEEEGGRIGAAQFEEDDWASAVDNGAGERLLGMDGNDDEAMDDKRKKKKKGKRSGYFSDESDHDDDDD
jgi:U11/U12 small nuclear ribonucleoprotein SNRNP31